MSSPWEYLIRELAILERRRKDRSMIFQSFFKEEAASYYGVTMREVDVEYNRWNAIFRCSEFDRVSGITTFPSEDRIRDQIDNPTLPHKGEDGLCKSNLLSEN